MVSESNFGEVALELKLKQDMVWRNTKLKQLGIVGINLKGTQKPSGKMKFTIILIGVMLLRGIELHRHMNWHGQDETQD